MRLDVVTVDRRYCLLALAWMGAIFWLSSRPELSTAGSGPVEQLASNLAHLPLFAGLAFCWFKALFARQEASWRRSGLAFLAAATCAALAEWLQLFVPGYTPSVGDVVMDLAGIGGMLFILRVQARREVCPDIQAEDFMRGRMTAFVTDGDQRPALAITRSLGQRGVSVLVGAEQPVSLASASKYCVRHVTYPSPYRHPRPSTGS